MYARRARGLYSDDCGTRTKLLDTLKKFFANSLWNTDDSDWLLSLNCIGRKELFTRLLHQLEFFLAVQTCHIMRYRYSLFNCHGQSSIPKKGAARSRVPIEVKSQVILYSGEPLWHYVEMAHLNTCAKSYSILFKRSSASIFSNRVPNWRNESVDVFRIVFSSENLTLSCRGGFEETEVSQRCSWICVYFGRKQLITWSCILVQ